MLAILIGLLMGAQDNVASAMGWIVAYPAFHSDLQEQIGEEVQFDGPTSNDRRNCGLLVSTVKEVLRLRPPAPANKPRRLLRSVEIAGQMLPKGTLVFHSFYNMHHNAAVFDRPNEFFPRGFRTIALTASRTTLHLVMDLETAWHNAWPYNNCSPVWPGFCNGTA